MNDTDEVKVKISAIEAKISATETQLASAISDGKDNLIGIYGNNLIELQKKENILLAGSGNLLSYWRST